MRILFPYLARWRSVGYSRYHGLFEAMARAGHEILVVEAPPRPSDELPWQEMPQRELHPNIRILTAPRPPLWNQERLPKLAAKAGLSLLSIPLIRSLVRSERIDLLVLYNLPQAPLLLRAPCPVLLDICDDLPAMLEAEARVPWAGAAGRKTLRFMVHRADEVVVSSKALLPFAPKARLVPNGADFPSVPPRRARGGPVVYVGAFEYFLDLDLLLRAAEMTPDRSFLLFGAGRRTAEVRQKARRLPNVEVYPAVPHEQLPSLLQKASVGVVPFVDGPVARAASPLKAFEYLAAGVPVVATEIADLQSLSGLVWRAQDARSFASAIERADEAGIDTRAWQAVARQRSWDELAGAFISSEARPQKIFASAQQIGFRQ